MKMMKKIFNKFSFEEVHLFIASILMAIITFIVIVWPNISDFAITIYILLCWSFEPPIMHSVYDYYKDKKDIIDKKESRGRKIINRQLRNFRIKKTVTKIINLSIYFLMVTFILLALCAACGWLIKLITALFTIAL